MPNRVRPRCPVCDKSMSPIFAHGPRGKSYVRIKDVFHCAEHDQLARGRKHAKFLD